MLKSRKTQVHRHMDYTQTLALGFVIMILIGTVLLKLPAAAYEYTSFTDALFTAVSATCVTGLAVFDTTVHWTFFGKTVLLILMQLGGMGFMFVVSLFAMMTGKKLPLHLRKLFAENTGALTMRGVVRLLSRIAMATFAMEGLGALLLAVRFCPMYGFGKGIAYAIFHSVSAFCNAGFDLTGKIAPYSSLTMFAEDPLVLLTTAMLVIIGGLGFFVWSDIIHCKTRISRWTLHTKLVMSTTAILLFGGWAAFFISEYNGALAGRPLDVKLLNAFFQSVTVRTAGFDALGQGNLSQAGMLISYSLMLIGGSPASTAGGIKTTTFAVMVMSIWSTVHKRKEVQVFHRRIEEETVRQSLAIVATYIFAVISGAMLLCIADPISAPDAVFEAISAISTVGLTAGITASLSLFSKIILMVLMFAGRIGCLSLLVVVANRKPETVPLRPEERLLVG